MVGRGGPIREAARDVDVVLVTTPDAAVAEVVAAIEPADAVVAHVSGSLGPAPLAGHERSAIVHPLVALPDPERGARRLRGAWFGVGERSDPVIDRVVADLDGRRVVVHDDAWPRYHAAAAIAANHLVALMGQVERVAATIGVPLEAYLDLAGGSLEDVRGSGAVRSLTGPVRRGDVATVRRHLDALPDDEREAYVALARAAARLVPDGDAVRAVRQLLDHHDEHEHRRRPST